MKDISISVIICTYNRCQMLRAALDSIMASLVPAPDRWEVLIVDNNSTDKTREIVEDYSALYPERVRYVIEKQQGLSFARNAGIREARGNILAFTDDDVIVELGWLRNLTEPLRDGHWVGAGGRIFPKWTEPLPPWISRDGPEISGPFVALDNGPVPLPLTQAPVGANMAYRKDVFQRYGGFRTDLGRRGNNLHGGEDTEFGQRLLANGEHLRYEPNAVVYHPVPESRLRKEYLLSWAVWHARSEVDISGIPKTDWTVAGVPLFLFRRLARWTLQWLVSIKPSKRFSCKQAVWHTAGSVSACYHLANDKKRKSKTKLEPRGMDAGL